MRYQCDPVCSKHLSYVGQLFVPQGLANLSVKNLSLLRKVFSRLLHIIIVISLLQISAAVQAAPYTIGLATWSGYPESVRGFKAGLAEAGLIEGQQVRFIAGKQGADKNLQAQVAAKFIQAKVDLVYSLTTPGTTVMQDELPVSMPIVFSIVTYPADSGLIESFQYSGNNLVGTSNYVPVRHYLYLLKLLYPQVNRIAIFHRRGEPNSQIQSANLLRMFRREGIEALEMKPENIQQVKRLAKQLIGQVDLFMTTTDTLMQAGGEEALIKLSLKHGIPILSSNKKGIEQGASFGPVADFYTLGFIAGQKAARILLDGIAPNKLESELQNPPLFLVNRNTIKNLGIPISPEAHSIVTWTDE
ncbi:ABC transporter substrate-binding protein [Aliamphritea ceti]|uniref:ABC transporter substrate-binding protein n=1 Tax=Aliamphritea ceti TaxID=1524258 RepID=UPI0021C429A6|nr:ABC transporter substrate-binding protein [Aliamphritea ceti]